MSRPASESESPAARSGFVPWAELGGDGVSLDPQVRPLVMALNQLSWVRTVFSCAGHPAEPDSVAHGRRQAHVDVVIAEPARWRRLVRQIKREAPAAVRRLGLPGAGLRCAEGSLGPLPEWLAAALPAPPPPLSVRPWWRRLLRLGGDGRGWRYRRLVLEPMPYDLAPDRCRGVLDAALGAALHAASAAQASPLSPSETGALLPRI
ncbi:MAG TPA: hypothetical protein VHS99_04130 [Chloroflexota bacterium]|jgi:hypothetical protein|nr:hypothetical protein [Chloroflexota bacterium]